MSSGDNIQAFFAEFDRTLRLIEPTKTEQRKLLEHLRKGDTGETNTDVDEGYLNDKVASLTRQVTNLTNELKVLKEDNDRLAKLAEQMRKKAIKAETDKRNAESEAESHKKTNDHLLQENQTLKARNRDLERKLTSEPAIEEGERKNRELLQVIEKLKEELGQTRKIQSTDELKVDSMEKKIAQMYEDLYKGEWKQAFKISEENYSIPSTRHDALKSILLTCYKVCKDEAQRQRKEVSRALLRAEPHQRNLDLPELGVKTFNICRTHCATPVIQALSERLLTPSKPNCLGPFARKVPTFVKQCVAICWLMVIQDPPLVFEDEKRPFIFDSTKYEPYSTSRSTLQREVWPVMLSQDGGSVLVKGVAVFRKGYTDF